MNAPLPTIAVAGPFALRIRLVDGREFDFDADAIPLVVGGATGGLADRLVRTVRRRDIPTLDGWIVEADGVRRRVTLATGAVLWVDDRETDEAAP